MALGARSVRLCPECPVVSGVSGCVRVSGLKLDTREHDIVRLCPVVSGLCPVVSGKVSGKVSDSVR